MRYKYKRRAITVITTVINRLFFAFNHVKAGQNFKSCGIISLYSNSNQETIKIGNNVYINSARIADPLGGDHKTIFATFDDGYISIGNNVGISNSTINAHIGVDIADDVMVGANVKIYDTDFHALEYEARIKNEKPRMKKVKIERGVFIGSSAIILKGTTIGENSVIGAGAVVSGNIPPNQIWAGNPARFIKQI